MTRPITFIDLILRFLKRRERKTQHSLHSASVPGTEPATVPVGSGEPQPGVRMLDRCQDIAQEYSSSARIGSSKSTAGERCPKASTAPEPKSILSALELVVDCGCETVVDSNQYGSKYCFGDTVGVCKFCGIRVCGECLKYETCTDSRSRWHRLEQ